MPNIHEMFPSKYVKSGELNDPVVLTIKEVQYERVYNPRKGDLGSQDTEDWVGGEIELYPTTVRVAGEKKAAIRVRKPGEKH
jgi:hypothetical protein